MEETGGMPGGSGRKSCLGVGSGRRSSGDQVMVLEKAGIWRTISFLMWLNCCSCERGSLKAIPMSGSRGIGTGLSRRTRSVSSSSTAGVVSGGGL